MADLTLKSVVLNGSNEIDRNDECDNKNEISSSIKILSWNIAGIRSSIKRGDLNFLIAGNGDIICFQETKAEPQQIIKDNNISKIYEIYKYRYWGINPGITQRKGFSGTSIWSKIPYIRVLEGMQLDTEGRIIALEFEKFVIINVYTPNSQELNCERFEFRKLWDQKFYEYIMDINNNICIPNNKPAIICGDFNVAYNDIDLHNPVKYKNKVAGFLDDERSGFARYITGDVPPFVDAFRFCNGNVSQAYTYWNQRMPHLRKNNIGWRIDYFLIAHMFASNVKSCNILPQIMGSDHCPVSLEISI